VASAYIRIADIGVSVVSGRPVSGRTGKRRLFRIRGVLLTVALVLFACAFSRSVRVGRQRRVKDTWRVINGAVGHHAVAPHLSNLLSHLRPIRRRR
jgi:hypothetical protein